MKGRSADETKADARADESSFGLRTLGEAVGLHLQFLPSGCLYAVRHGEIQVNQILASPVGGGIHRIYLRRRDGNRIESKQIVGPGCASEFAALQDRCVWRGRWGDLEYTVIARLHGSKPAWFFDVELRNKSASSARFDVIQLQDIGIATRGQVRNNELFTSQYIDHTAVERETGFVVMSRQNLRQGRCFPWLMQGCTKARGFTTSAFDFFGVNCKSGAAPAALARDVIGDRVRQDETAYIALQSDLIDVPAGAAQSMSFFALYVEDHPAASSKDDLAQLRGLLTAPPRESTAGGGKAPPRNLFNDSALFETEEFTADEVVQLFPGKRHEEFAGGRLQSLFYSAAARHVVFRDKELSSPRPHGHIIKAGRGLMPDDELMSCTSYASGVFASHITLGNVSVGKLISGIRDPLNIVRSGGVRVFVRGSDGDAWQLLGVPTAFGMSTTACRYHYKHHAGRIVVTVRAAAESPAVSIDVRSIGPALQFLVCAEITSGSAEYEHRPEVTFDRARSRITIRPGRDSLMGQKLPEATLHICCATPQEIAEIGGDDILFADQQSRNLPYCTLRTHATNAVRLWLVGDARSAARADELARNCESTPETEDSPPRPHSVVIEGSDASLAAVADTMPWFARDAIVHLSVPHGLEQASGGAWGVRDVCQGPVEFLLSHDDSPTVAEILRRVFARQDPKRGDWRQWFMFPPFEEIRSDDRHGDVLIWPLKALCDYLEHSADGALLAEHVDQVDKLLARVRADFLPGLSLPRYGEGDWDDSLQPADPHLREKMVSSWTTALLVQTLRRYRTALEYFRHDQRAAAVGKLADEIAADYRKHLMPDGVVAGFAVFDGSPPRPVEYLLHPSDSRTGIRYRLISMTRGVLSGLVAGDAAARHMQLLHEHLFFPDGVRLMDRPTKYAGGVERTFRRSESSANFGREIGLQYVHAHLRYAETMALMGDADRLWKALLVVNPIAVTDVVPNARARQRNCYFSSSDAAFCDRYEAVRDFDKLRRGEVSVDGGWRIYSSGPGIYTSLVIRHLFGLRKYYDYVEFDPVLPAELDGAACELSRDGRRVRYEFSRGERAVFVNSREMELAADGENLHRRGAIRVARDEFAAALGAADAVVRVQT